MFHCMNKFRNVKHVITRLFCTTIAEVSFRSGKKTDSRKTTVFFMGFNNE